MIVCLALSQATSARPLDAGDSNPRVTQMLRISFKKLTFQADRLRNETEPLNAYELIVKGLDIAPSLQMMNGIVDETAAYMHADSLDDADAKLVVGWLTSFVAAEKSMLDVLVKKRQDLDHFPHTVLAPVEEALSHFQGSFEKFSGALTRAMPTQEASAKEQFDALSQALEEALDAYKAASAGFEAL
jgi:hypothetical protein